jgi:ABC-2 type transport system ATP-binding protein
MSPVLELDGVSRRFGEVVALDELSFSLAPGELGGFVGANGAGKTTAMRIIMGVERPDAGEVRWNGARLVHEARRRFGYMPEERGLYPKMRVLDQLVYLATLHGMNRADAARDASWWLEQLGLGERMTDRLEQLSLGNQQRVQLVAAMTHEPDLLVLDEPFSGIDPVALETMSGAVLDYAHERGVPVLFSSHQLELVERLCDTVVIIDAGRLVAAGDVAELRRQGRRRDRRLRIEVAGARESDWARRLDGVHVVEEAAHGDIVETWLQIDDPSRIGEVRESVLDAARAAGAVIAFEEARPTLTELYRDAVASNRDRAPAAIPRTRSGGTHQ